MNTTPHINRQKVKRTALELSNARGGESYRACGFTRVSNDFLEAIEAATRKAITDRIKSNPSSKTLK